ncbi:MAG TPA: Gfo/Idh/MocA family oxidoreductase, partial [Planctomycetota bacterium]|nr:Gfo/Idh/MocA family oxidoreductase [Planctomycetota bacterium]
MSELTRRTFLGASATALAAMGAKAAPSERLRVAVIGIRGQGGFHARLWAGMPDVEVVALCDVDERVFAGIAGQVEKKSGHKPRFEKDMRRLFEDKSIDAVSIATPNHWHILP